LTKYIVYNTRTGARIGTHESETAARAMLRGLQRAYGNDAYYAINEAHDPPTDPDLILDEDDPPPQLNAITAMLEHEALHPLAKLVYNATKAEL